MTPDKQKVLNSNTLNNLQIPYMKLLPKVHKLTSTASTSNLKDLTGRPIITAHSWTTSNPSRLLGTELDTIILRLKDLFAIKNIHFSLIYNSTEVTDLLQQQHISDIDNYCLKQHLTSLHFTLKSHIKTLFMPSSPAARFLTSLTLTAIFYLILTVSLITVIFSLLVITSTSKHKVLPWAATTAGKSPTLCY